MKNIDKSKPVMLTGATGYLGGHIAKKLIGKWTYSSCTNQKSRKQR
ncbi:hypothetical protein OAA49_02395 [Flavobacteriales bacterium]|nr:hypothetical protein [Flavobacteriales bacterium]